MHTSQELYHPPSPLRPDKKYRESLTIYAGIIRLDEDFLHSSVGDFQGVAFAARLAENGRGIEGEGKCVGEGAVRIGEEADLDRRGGWSVLRGA